MAEKAGELEVPVVADLSNFARELKEKVEAAAKRVEAEVQATIDSSGLRRELKRAVDEAAAGVKATVEVEVDRNQAREALENAFGKLGKKIRTAIGGNKGEIAKDVAEASAEGQAVANRDPILVPVRTDRRGLIRDWLRERLSAQREMEKAPPVAVPVTVRLGRVFAGLRSLMGVAILPLIGPAVSAIGSLAAGLGAISAAAAPAVGVLGGLPGILSALVGGFAAATIAFSGFGDTFKAISAGLDQVRHGEKMTAQELKVYKQAMDDTAPSVVDFIGKILDLKDDWKEVKKSIQEPIFAALTRQITPLAKNLLPILKTGLTDTSRVLGSVIDSFGNWMSTPAFKGDFKTILGGNNALLGSFGQALQDVAAAFVDILVASQPFLRRVGRVIEAFGRWIRETANAGRESGKFADFLDRAANTASKLWSIVKNLAGGLFGVFKAGTSEGESLLDSIDKNAQAFNDWANGEGQKKLQKWFHDSMPAFKQIAGLIGDVAKALGRMSVNKDTAGMIQQIREQIIPAVEEFLTTVSEQAPRVIDLISDVLDALSGLGDAGTPLGAFVDIIDKVAEGIDWFTEHNPEATKALTEFLGALLAFKAAKSIVGLFSPFKKGGGLVSMILGGGKGGKHAAKGGGLATSLLGGILPAAKRIGSKLKGAITGGAKGLGSIFGIGKGADAGKGSIDKFTGAVKGSTDALGDEIKKDGEKVGSLGKVGGAADGSSKKVGVFSRIVSGTKKALGVAVSALGGWASGVGRAVGRGAASFGRGAAAATRMTVTVVAEGGKQAVSWAANMARVAAASIASWVTTTAKAAAGALRMTAVVIAEGAKQALSWIASQARVLAATIGAWVAGTARAIAGILRMTAVVVANALTQAAVMAASAARVVAGWILMGTQSLIQAGRMAAAWFIALGPIGWVIAAIIALALIIYLNWDKIKGYVIGAWNAIWGKAKQIWALITSFIGTQIDMAKMRVQRGIDRIKGAIDTLRSIPGKVRQFFWQMAQAVGEKITDAYNKVKALKGKVTGFFSNAGSWLLDAGKNVVRGLISGVKSMIGSVKKEVGKLADKVREYWPFSPAKVGPLKKYPMDKAGANIVGMLSEGMLGEQSTLIASMRRITGLVAEPGGAGSPLSALANRDGTEPAAAASNGAVFNDGAIRIYNPSPEPASESAAKRLPRVAAFGLFGS